MALPPASRLSRDLVNFTILFQGFFLARRKVSTLPRISGAFAAVVTIFANVPAAL